MLVLAFFALLFVSSRAADRLCCASVVERMPSHDSRAAGTDGHSECCSTAMINAYISQALTMRISTVRTISKKLVPKYQATLSRSYFHTRQKYISRRPMPISISC